MDAAVSTGAMGAGLKCMLCCKGARSDKGVTRTPALIVDLVAVAGVVLAVFSIVTSDLILADIAGGLLVIFCPYMAYQKRALSKLSTFREALNDLRGGINDFMNQNNILSRNVTRLSNSVDELEQVESELGKLANTDNVDRLVEVVRETKANNAEMKKITQASVVQQLITTVIRTDRDLDLKIGPIELKRLMARLDATAGFEFHGDRFVALLGDTNQPVDISKIMKVIRNLKDDSLSDEDNVFVMRPEQLLDKK
jgi:hypothetical protein